VKNKTALHYNFLIAFIAVIIWSLTVMFKDVYGSAGPQVIFWENMTYIGAATVPVGVLILAKSYAQSGKGFTKKYYLLYIIPAITILIIWSNHFHGWFYMGDPVSDVLPAYGWYFYVHAVFSYVCLIYGFGILIYYALKNSGPLSIQAVLILLGSLIPFVANVLYTFRVNNFNVYSTPLAFSATLVMYMLGLFRFNLLKVSPIALQTIINRISDSFIVFDRDMNVIDFNQTFTDNFYYLNNIKKGVI
jgi:hypothetical protein